ncbi:uncharacterized protein LOC111630157 [Centruroides sculpturatus]|uniref:uncharacterized protein LOC111630157 n=1 Tax=Centruroides sculpturatus TaxID=218467 RepID=UPI000C6CB537|nr:uncharacterized protein LOC111630157 [Centruroides sculpturatus]
MENFIAAHGLLVVNDPDSPPTFSSSNGHSWIDLTICSKGLCSVIQNWQVGIFDCLSDHECITYSLGCNNLQDAEASNNKNAFNTKAADWCEFQDTIQRIGMPSSRIVSHTEAKTYIESAIFKISSACVESIPRRKNKKRVTPWWNLDLSLMRQNNNRLRRIFQRCHDERREELRLQYLSCQRGYKEAIKKAKLDSWKSFCAGAGRDP